MRREVAREASSSPSRRSRRPAMRCHGSLVTRPQLSRAQPFTARHWPWNRSVYMVPAPVVLRIRWLHPAATLAERGNFLEARGQYGTMGGHAIVALLARGARAQHVLRQGRRFLDHEDVHGAQRHFRSVRVFGGEAQRQATREADGEEFVHGLVSLSRPSILTTPPTHASRTDGEPS